MAGRFGSRMASAAALLVVLLTSGLAASAAGDAMVSPDHPSMNFGTRGI